MISFRRHCGIWKVDGRNLWDFQWAKCVCFDASPCRCRKATFLFLCRQEGFWRESLRLFWVNYFHRCNIPEFRDSDLSICIFETKLSTVGHLCRIFFQILWTARFFIFPERVLLVTLGSWPGRLGLHALRSILCEIKIVKTFDLTMSVSNSGWF